MKKKNLIFVILFVLLLTLIFVACDNSAKHSNTNKTYDSNSLTITEENNEETLNLKAIYNNANCSTPWAKVAGDGSYIQIDSNPYDYDNSDYPYLSTLYLSNAINAIQKINSKLGLPDSLYQQMIKTTALQGLQSKKYSSIGIEVSWSYHPDNGLEVMYSKIFD